MPGADQQALALDVERVAKRSTSRVVRRPAPGDRWDDASSPFMTTLAAALDRAGVKPGESFYVHRVPPPDRRSHLGDLEGLPGSRSAARRQVLAYFEARPEGATAAEATYDSVEGGWRRVSELVAGGHLQPTGKTRENAPGHPARVLVITDRGRAALEGST